MKSRETHDSTTPNALIDAGHFTGYLDTAIPFTDPETMTRALNNSLEARVRENPEQWFWIHNRWKGGTGG